MTRSDILSLVIKVFVSLGLLAWLLSRQPLGEIRQVLAHPSWPWLWAALAVYGASNFAGAMQWGWLLRAAGSTARYRELLRLYLIGLFFSNFLPANIGGDAYKIIDLGRRERNPHRAFAATILDRLLGLAALTALGVLAGAVAALAGFALPRAVWLLAASGLFLLLVGILLLSRRLGPRVPPLFERLRLPGVARQAGAVAREFQGFRTQPALLGRVLACSALVQIMRVATHVLVARGLHLSLTQGQTLQFFVLVPMLAISLTLPVTINGIGLREGLAALLLPWTGLTIQAGVAVEAAAFAVQIAFSLTGGALFWFGCGRRELPSAAGVERPGEV